MVAHERWSQPEVRLHVQTPQPTLSPIVIGHVPFNRKKGKSTSPISTKCILPASARALIWWFCKGFFAPSFDFLQFAHGSTIVLSLKNGQLITGKKKVNFSGSISASSSFMYQQLLVFSEEKVQ